MSERRTIELNIPESAAERVAIEYANRECQCPLCGRLHRHLRAGMPPEIIRNQIAPKQAAEPLPIPMVLFCPCCSTQHIDAPQPEKNWTNPPHRSHECQVCGFVWRPADVTTNGVKAITTKGERDMDKCQYHRLIRERLARCEEALRKITQIADAALSESALREGERL